MTTKISQWRLTIVFLGLGLLSGCALAYILHAMTTVPKGMSAAPNPSIAGVIQAVIALFSTGGFTMAGIIAAIAKLFGSGGATPIEQPKDNVKASILADLIEAFPAYLADRGNRAKAMRFWFDLIQFGIEFDPDPETKAWLHSGSEILRKKFFPAIDVKSIESVNVPSIV